MIPEFVAAFMENKQEIRSGFSKGHPADYQDIIKAVVEILPSIRYTKPDANRIHLIDDGDYQGTLLFIIAEEGYQPSTYWSVFVSYGSCSGCDTLESIRGYSDDAPTERQLDDYMTLALHIVQGLSQLE